MTSPVDLALAGYDPAPPPPLSSSSSSRPFARPNVAAAEPCVNGPSLVVTPQSTRDGPSPSWMSLNDSVDGFGTPLQSLHLSAPHTPSLEVVSQPPPFTPGRSHSVASTSPCASARRREPLVLMRGGSKPSKAQMMSASLTTPHRGGAPALTFHTYPPPLGFAEERAGGAAREKTAAVPFGRSDSLPTPATTATATMDVTSTADTSTTDGASLSPLRSQKSAPNPPSLTFARPPTAGTSGLHEDQQPALPQRVYPSQLALFVDCMPSPNSASATLTGAVVGMADSSCALLSSSFGLSRATPSTTSGDFSTSATTRTWGCARGAFLNLPDSASSQQQQHQQQHTPSSFDAVWTADTEAPTITVATTAGAIPPPTRVALAPAPPTTPPSARGTRGKRWNGRHTISPFAASLQASQSNWERADDGEAEGRSNTGGSHAMRIH